MIEIKLTRLNDLRLGEDAKYVEVVPFHLVISPKPSQRLLEIGEKKYVVIEALQLALILARFRLEIQTFV